MKGPKHIIEVNYIRTS